MKKFAILLISLIFATLMLGITGCEAKGSIGNDTASLTLKTYTVPAGREKDLTHTLDHVLNMGEKQPDIGNAWVAGPGQILVLAPARMQDSIAKSIKEIVSHAGAAAKPLPLRLNAWVVDAYPGKGQDDPALKTIQPALDAFAADMGASHFTGVHYFTSVSDAGVQAGMTPIPGNFLQYRITPGQDGVVIRFNYVEPASSHDRRQVNLHGQVTTRLGQNLVLGLVSDRSNGKGGGSVRRLLVVRIVPANQG